MECEGLEGWVLLVDVDTVMGQRRALSVAIAISWYHARGSGEAETVREPCSLRACARLASHLDVSLAREVVWWEERQRCSQEQQESG